MKTQSTTKGFAILSAAGMVAKLLSLLYIPFLLHILGETGYGVYYAAYIIFSFIYIITNSGMSSAIAKIVSELVALEAYKDAVKTFKIARFLMLLIGTIMATLMILLAVPLAKITNFSLAYLAIKALAPAVVFTSVASAYRGYFQGRGNMNPTAVSQIIEQMGNVVFSLLFAALWMRYGVAAGCAGGTVGTTLGAVLSAGYLVRYYRAHKSFRVPKGYNLEEASRHSNRELLRKLLKYSLPLTISWGAQNAGNVIDITNTKGRLKAAGFNEDISYEKVGYLGKYQTLIGVPITIISALCAAILPLISGAAAKNDRDEVKRGINFAFKLCFLIAIPSAVGLAVLSDPIFRMLFPRYTNGAFLMKIGSSVLILMALVQIQTTILQSVGKLYMATLYIVLGIIGKITINYILIAIPAININGAIVGSIIGFLIPLILNDLLIKRTLRIRFNLVKGAVKPLIASVFMGITAYVVQFDFEFLIGFIKKGYIATTTGTVIGIAAGVFVYLYSLILVGGITKRDLNAMPSKLVRLIPGFMLEKVK